MGFAIEARNISRNKHSTSFHSIDALAIEYFDDRSLVLLREEYGDMPDNAKACIFFEQEYKKVFESEIFGEWMGLLSKHGGDEFETWVAYNDRDRELLLEKRHFLGETMNQMIRINKMPKVTTDIAVPDNKFTDIMGLYKRVLAESQIEYFLFGHIGDSHIHMNLLPKTPQELEKSWNIALTFIEKSVELGGTVSAEHGIGKMRREYMKILYGEKGIQEMLEVKKALDPNLILGRGNIFQL